MTASKITPSQLLQEKSLWDLYLLSFKFPVSKFNLLSTTVIALCLILYTSILMVRNDQIGPILKEIIKLGISIAPSILGFLIAGFTVFVTITKPSVFEAMAKKEYESSGQSYLKYNLSAFMLAFFHYVTYLATCVVITIFGQPNGALTAIVRIISNNSPLPFALTYSLILSIATISFGCWTWYLVMLLKSFIYNVYHVVATTVRWDLEKGSQSQIS